jgi:hypothetical protein
MMGMM